MKKFLLHPHAPVWAGSTLVFTLCLILVRVSGAPGALAMAHHQVPELSGIDGCMLCHGENGITSGCLQCHEEIRTQLSANTGYHGYLERERGSECADCHSEHHGTTFPLVNTISWGPQVEGAFRHPHVEFGLEGAHDLLDCAECHGSEPTAVDGIRVIDPVSGFATPTPFERTRTFLGLEQECVSCHVDEHTDGLTGDCLECHTQHSFDTPFFDHTEHLLLTGGHNEVACSSCHVVPDLDTPRRPFPFPFEETRGSGCEDCHGTPHRVPLGESCLDCHSPEHGDFTHGRDKITPEIHARAGFRLSSPHLEVSCDACHSSDLPFAERHPDPHGPLGRQRTPETCEGCHDDVHGGQFLAKHDHCVDCHIEERFSPTRFGHEDHRAVFDLTGAHSAVACSACHTVPTERGGEISPRIFVGTPRLCRDCHEDPHAGQFDDRIAADDCTHCHSANGDHFLVQRFDHEAMTGTRLEGAHTRAACGDCHREGPIVHRGVEKHTRLFSDIPSECATCHVDVHQGQFADYDACDVCHTSQESFHSITFDHDTQSDWPLVGAHREVPCGRCHTPEKLLDGTVVVRYEPIPHQCGDCHDIVPESQR